MIAAAALARALAEGRTTARAAAEGLLERIAALNPTIRCFLAVEPERIRTAADAADQRRAAGAQRGPLDGVPFAAKDIFRRSDRPTTGGTAPAEPPTGETASVLVRLAAAGCVDLGPLALDELAAAGDGANHHFGRCANPWRLERICGGSSSGSAAAVAAGLAPIAIGSDAGGSTRLPAAYCGVVGLKPTYGRVSRAGALARSFSMDSIGPIARTVEDCALALEALAGADPADPTASDAPVPPYAQRLRARTDLSGVRVGRAANPELAPFDDETGAALDQVEARLAALGAAIAPVSLPDLADLADLQQVLVKCEAAALHGARLRADPDGIGPIARAVILDGLLIPAPRYIEALSLRADLLARHLEIYDAVDVVLAPVAPGPAPLVEPVDQDPAATDRRFSAGARFTRFANYLGVPALALPIGLSRDGLPLAAQLLAPPFAESRLLVVAHLLQQALPPLPDPPWTRAL